MVIPLFWGLFTFKPHFKSHPYWIVVFNRFHILIVWNNELGWARPVRQFSLLAKAKLNQLKKVSFFILIIANNIKISISSFILQLKALNYENTPGFVVDSEHGFCAYGMPCSCKDTKVHTMARNDWRWDIGKLSHSPSHANTKLTSFSSALISVPMNGKNIVSGEKNKKKKKTISTLER